MALAVGGKGALNVATELCRDLGTRTIVGDGGDAPTVRMLVTADGRRGWPDGRFPD